MHLCSWKCVLNSKGYLYHFLSSPCCDIFPGDVWTSASRSHSGFPPQAGAEVDWCGMALKRKLRPLSRHKYHNSILNNASLLGRGLTQTRAHPAQRKTNTHTNCCLVFNSPLTQTKSGEVVQLSKCFSLMHLIYYQTKASSYNWDCHRRVSFVPLFYCGLWCHRILHFWLLCVCFV